MNVASPDRLTIPDAFKAGRETRPAPCRPVGHPATVHGTYRPDVPGYDTRASATAVHRAGAGRSARRRRQHHSLLVEMRITSRVRRRWRLAHGWARRRAQY